MKYAVWSSNHDICNTVAKSVCASMLGQCTLLYCDRGPIPESHIEAFDVHIAYGILRGTGDVFNLASKLGKPYFNIDRGYFGAGHFEGTYRISLNGTQQTTGLDRVPRGDYHGVIDPPQHTLGGHILLCPPTEHAANFFGVNPESWLDFQTEKCQDHAIVIRPKGSVRPLEHDLHKCAKVVTFNSSVGWDALRQGIMVESNMQHSIVGAWSKNCVENGAELMDSRAELFSCMLGIQLTLSEMRAGKLLPLIEQLLEHDHG